jgi:hypothetical protein
MKIILREVSVRELVDQYRDQGEDGVYGYGGKLNIRPPYQREFVYKDQQQSAVIETVIKAFPLNVLYWADLGEGQYEVIDGQQRILSICNYVVGNFAYNQRYFHNLTKAEQESILNYKLMVYVCDGAEREKLDWFRIINISGERLTDQELRNAAYNGPWVTDAKRFFSRSNGPAHQIACDYLNGRAIRQEYLETALSWISHGEVDDYMAKQQRNPNASALWLYFQNVIAWVKVTFPNYRKEMKGVEWGVLYNQFHDQPYDHKAIEAKIKTLMMDDDVTNKKGVYSYILTQNTKHLNLRAFTPSQKRTAYEQQNGECPVCKGKFQMEDMEGDHKTPWHLGGKTTLENLQMLCRSCNRNKAGR